MRRFACLAVLAALIAAGCPSLPAAAQISSGARPRECPPSMQLQHRQACLSEINAEADAALIVARRDAVRAIADWNGNIDAAGKTEWAKKFERMLDLWLKFRDQSCSATLMRFETGAPAEGAEMAASACRVRISRVIVADLTNRFGEALADLGRGSFALGPRGPNRRELIGAEGRQPLCRHPGSGGDYQPLTACYERNVARVDRDLNAVWGQVLSAITHRGGVTTADRTTWTATLRDAQRTWAELRDLACRLEAYETPNRFANSVYSQVTGPCLIVETEARIRALKSAYGIR